MLNNKVVYQSLCRWDLCSSALTVQYFLRTLQNWWQIKKRQFENDSCNVPLIIYFLINCKSLDQLPRNENFSLLWVSKDSYLYDGSSVVLALNFEIWSIITPGNFKLCLINTMEKISDRENKMSMHLNVLYPRKLFLLRGNKIHYQPLLKACPNLSKIV